jgi:hypothetical protein
MKNPAAVLLSSITTTPALKGEYFFLFPQTMLYASVMQSISFTHPLERRTSMTDLSPAAQSVLDAYRSTHLSINNLVAALRAAADQRIELEVPFLVVDEWEKVKGSCARFYAAAEWGRAQALQELLAIADELDNTSQPSK